MYSLKIRILRYVQRRLDNDHTAPPLEDVLKGCLKKKTGVELQTVHETIRYLAEAGCLTVRPNGTIWLTQQGREALEQHSELNRLRFRQWIFALFSALAGILLSEPFWERCVPWLTSLFTGR